MKVSKLEKLFKEAYELGNQNAVQPRKKKGPINVAFKRWFVEQSKKSKKSNNLDSVIYDEIKRPLMERIVVLEGELRESIKSCNDKDKRQNFQSDQIKKDSKTIGLQKNRILALQEQLDEREIDNHSLRAKAFNAEKELEKSFNKTQFFLMGVLGGIIGGLGVYFYFAYFV